MKILLLATVSLFAVPAAVMAAPGGEVYASELGVGVRSVAAAPQSVGIVLAENEDKDKVQAPEEVKENGGINVEGEETEETDNYDGNVQETVDPANPPLTGEYMVHIIR